MKDRTKSILIAVSFIVAMVLFVWGFNFLKGKSILNNQFNFYAVYSNSKGLLPGDLVTINGMQVGTVSSLKFHPKQDGSIVVEFTTNNNLNIPDNSVVKLSSSLMGSVSLNLILGIVLFHLRPTANNYFLSAEIHFPEAVHKITVGVVQQAVIPGNVRFLGKRLFI